MNVCADSIHSIMARQLFITLPTCLGAVSTSSMDNDNAVYIASICAVVFLSALGMLIRQRGSNQPPYPPGPRRYPLIGSALGVPRGVPIWQAFISISRKYSECSVPVGGYLLLKVFPLSDTDILHINLFSTDYIVLNSSEAISDLLDKRSAIYSDRVRRSSSPHSLVLTDTIWPGGSL